MAVHAGRSAQIAVARLVAGGQPDDGDPGSPVALQLADAACHLVPVEVGEVHVEQAEVVGAGAPGAQRLGPGAHEVHVVAEAFEEGERHLGVEVVVLGHEHPGEIPRGRVGGGGMGDLEVRHGEPHRGPTAGRVVERPELAAHGGHEGVRQGQSDAARVQTVGTGVECHTERVVDPRTGVAHLEPQGAADALGSHPQGHRSSGRDADGVHEEVDEHLAHGDRVGAAERRQVAVADHGDVYALCGRLRFEQAGDRRREDHGIERHGMPDHLSRPLVGGQEAVEDRCQMLGPGADRVDRRSLGRVEWRVEEHARQTEDAAERRAHLVGERREIDRRHPVAEIARAAGAAGAAGAAEARGDDRRAGDRRHDGRAAGTSSGTARGYQVGHSAPLARTPLTHRRSAPSSVL